jgi:hypothetical protein
MAPGKVPLNMKEYNLSQRTIRWLWFTSDRIAEYAYDECKGFPGIEKAIYWVAQKMMDLSQHVPHRCEIVDDQCGMPAHRFCIWCNRPAPNEELSEE